jgi:hypothetical protein
VNWIRLFAAATVTAICAPALSAQRLGRATVHIDAFDPFGSRIQNAKVRLYTPNRDRDLAERIQGDTIRNVPYGEYVLVVTAGSGIGTREVVVNSDEVWIRIGLEFFIGSRDGPSGDITVNGEIRPAPQQPKDWWVRIDGVFLHFSRESPVSASGRFSAGLFPMGTYLVQVFEGAKLRHSETIEIDTKQLNPTFTIDIP